ncbi:MAG: sensor histidine kinase [Myxococcales bacterium]
METPEHQPAADVELQDLQLMCADMLDSLASRWRFRTQAGRLGSHRMTEAAELVRRLERAASMLRDEPAAARADLTPLIASEERFRALVDGVTDYAIFMLDREGRVASWNAGAERIKGYRAEEILGQPVSRFYLEEDASSGKAERELTIAAREGRYTEEGWRVRKDGTRFWANVVLTAIRDSEGRLIGFAKVTRDLSEQRRAAEYLKASEERFKLLVESLKDYAVFMLDPQGIVVSWNRGAERIKGYRAEEIIGTSFSRFYTEQDRANGKPLRALNEALTRGKFEEEMLRVRKDGQTFWAHVTLTPLRAPDGTLLGFAKVTRDVTERRMADEALREFARDLERRVEARTAELREANAELEAFAYSVSHDLRAPLRAIDGFSQALLDDYGDRLDAGGLRLLTRVRAGAQRMARLIDDMLMLSRLGRAHLRRDPLDVTALARRIAADLERAEPGRTLRFDIADGLRADADAGLLEIALRNLLGNAVKFTRTRQFAHIAVGETERDGRRAFFVRDDGVGFDMAYAARLARPFQRLHHEDEFEGTGIGLATVRRVVQRHGGELWFEGAPERGATFTFTLAPPTRPGEDRP